MPFCRNCGKEISTEWEYCPGCGKYLVIPKAGSAKKDSEAILQKPTLAGAEPNEAEKQPNLIMVKGKTELFLGLVIGSILDLVAGHISKGKVLNKYPVYSIDIFAHTSFILGAVMTMLEPRIKQGISEAKPQLGFPDIGALEDWVNQIESIREEMGIVTSEPYFVWVGGEIDDAIKSGKDSMAFDQTCKIGLLSFLYGCILGDKNDKSVKSMFEADIQTYWVGKNTNISWGDFREIGKELLKKHAF